MHRFDVFSVPLHDVSEDELRARLFDVQGMIVTPNPEILLAARTDETYRALLQSATLSLPDGVATQFAVAALHDHLQLRRHPGVDVIPRICAMAEQQHETLIVIGGFPNDHRKIQERLLQEYPNLVVRCVDPGMLPDAASTLDDACMTSLRSCGPSIALIALGQGKGRAQGKQERIAKYVVDSCANVRFAIGVGGSIDVLSGRINRGPVILRRFGFEWIWRLIRDPWRLPRIFRAVIVFPASVAWDTLKQKRFLRACTSVTRALLAHFTRR